MSIDSSFVSHNEAFLKGTDSPLRLLEKSIAAINEKEGDVGAFVQLNLEMAEKQVASSAQRWRDGTPLSLLDGMVIGVKDIIETAEFLDWPLYFQTPFIT